MLLYRVNFFALLPLNFRAPMRSTQPSPQAFRFIVNFHTGLLATQNPGSGVLSLYDVSGSTRLQIAYKLSEELIVAVCEVIRAFN